MGRKPKQAAARADPDKRKLVEAPRKKKVWTPEEEAYIQDKWGTVSIPGMAKILGRSENAIVVRAQRLGCGAHLQSDVRVSLNQLMLALYGGISMGTYTNNRLIRHGLPVKWHRVKNSRFRVIDIEDFWKWAEQNKGLLDFSRFEELSLGAEPEWVKVKRKADRNKLQRHGHHNAAWTATEDQKLIRMLKQHKYTYQDIARELRHSEGAVKRRITDLKLKERPIRMPNQPWTEEEIETLCTMVSQGYDWSQIAEKVGRTALATRGKYERLQNPEYMKRYNRGENSSYEYQTIYGIDANEVLDRHKAMLGLEFVEAPPEQHSVYQKKGDKSICSMK